MFEGTISDQHENGAVPVDMETWERRTVYGFFSKFTEPYHGVCVRLDCTESFLFAKANGLSVFLTLLHRGLMASHQVENLRTRIVDGVVWRYSTIHGGSAVGRPNGTIGFAYYPHHADVRAFVREASVQMEQVTGRDDLVRHPRQNIIRFSVLPWLDFTSISHARNYGAQDSAPLITFGKITEAAGRRTMPVSIHVHHALADGLHVGQFVEQFQRYLAEPELA